MKLFENIAHYFFQRKLSRYYSKKTQERIDNYRVYCWMNFFRESKQRGLTLEEMKEIVMNNDREYESMWDGFYEGLFVFYIVILFYLFDSSTLFVLFDIF